VRKFHVVLTAGVVVGINERDVTAAEVLVHNGSLVFRNEAGDDVLIYADGAWVYVEVERLDDQ
jgi:hypothetical protein